MVTWGQGWVVWDLGDRSSAETVWPGVRQRVNPAGGKYVGGNTWRSLGPQRNSILIGDIFFQQTIKMFQTIWQYSNRLGAQTKWAATRYQDRHRMANVGTWKLFQVTHHNTVWFTATVGVHAIHYTLLLFMQHRQWRDIWQQWRIPWNIKKKANFWMNLKPVDTHRRNHATVTTYYLHLIFSQGGLYQRTQPIKRQRHWLTLALHVGYYWQRVPFWTCCYLVGMHCVHAAPWWTLHALLLSVLYFLFYK